MFQNISKDSIFENQNEDVELNKKEQIKNIIKRLLSKNNVVLYIITFLLSIVNFKSSDNLIFSAFVPFGIAIIAAAFSNGNAIGIMYLLSIIGTFIGLGTNGLAIYIVTSLLFFALILIFRPKLQEEVNEKRKVGQYLFWAVFIVQVVPMFFKTFYLYELLTSIMLGITTYIFYKIFVSSITLIKDFNQKKAYTIEEVMGTSLVLAIAVSALGDFNIFGFSIRNILSILIVLVLGWKNGILVGTTGGVTIGIVLGIICGSEPIMIAAYAVSGMIAGILNKFGKIGVIIGFILGNVIIAYVSNGNTENLIIFQEILIASLGLIAIPKNMQINIEDLYGTTKLLPETTGRDIEGNKDTIYKLTSISDTINDMADSYAEAAATILSEEELKSQERTNLDIFFEELRQELEDKEDNMIYEPIYYPENGLISDIFDRLLEKEMISEKDLIAILAKYNNYVVGFEGNSEKAKEDISKMIKVINSSYRISKINFIWKKKMDESKKIVSNQLKGVSEAISKMAVEIDNDNKDEFADKKDEVKKLLEQKEIEIKDIHISKSNSGRYTIDIYTSVCNTLDGTDCDIKKISKILQKVFNEKMIIQNQECGLRINRNECKFTYMSEDNYSLQIGIAKSTKASSPVSGDTSIQIRLDDGKYLIALSDGMGSGPEAMKSSKIAIKMLERLLKAGFEKDVSMKLINSTLSANTEDDMYATLDMQILDLFNGNMEFIKNSACPTYVKRGNEVQLLKSISLPTGILENVDLIVYDYDLQDGDILVMCSDGIIDSTKEYINKQVWLKYLLEDIETNDAQKIADIIIGEAIDNDFGVQKDDMTVIVTRINKKNK